MIHAFNPKNLVLEPSEFLTFSDGVHAGRANCYWLCLRELRPASRASRQML